MKEKGILNKINELCPIEDFDAWEHLECQRISRIENHYGLETLDRQIGMNYFQRCWDNITNN